MAAQTIFPLGAPMRLSLPVTVAGTPADATEVTLFVRDPAGAETSYTLSDDQIVRDGVGQYHYDLTPEFSGLWWYRCESSGTVIAASFDQHFTVAASTLVDG